MTIDLTKFIELTVPQNLLIIFISPIAAYVVINQMLPGLEIIPIMLSLSFAVLGFNSLNMVFALELDNIDKPKRPLPSGRVTVDEAIKLSVFLFLTSFIISFFTNLEFVLLLIAFFVVSYIYSSPIIHIKKYIWGSSFTGTFQYALIPVLSAATISPKELPVVFFVYVISTYLVISNVKDIEDVDGEKENKISSFPILFGVNNTLALVLIGPIVLNVCIAILIFANIIEKKYFYLVMASIISYSAFALLIWREHKKTYGNKNITTQSNVVTLTTIATLFSQIVYAIVAMFG